MLKEYVELTLGKSQNRVVDINLHHKQIHKS